MHLNMQYQLQNKMGPSANLQPTRVKATPINTGVLKNKSGCDF